jgi:hypothetical protein
MKLSMSSGANAIADRFAFATTRNKKNLRMPPELISSHANELMSSFEKIFNGYIKVIFQIIYYKKWPSGPFK